MSGEKRWLALSRTSRKTHAGPARPEIESSWARSRLNGLRQDGSPGLRQGTVAGVGGLTRAAGPVMERVRAELDGTPFAFVLADRSARIVDIRCSDRALGGTLGDLGMVPGVRFGEDEVGTNAIGTPVETRQGLFVRGGEHFLAAFHDFACYGHPIVHPLTRRLEGVVNIGGRAGEEHRLFSPLVRRVVRDIEDRLQLDASGAQRKLLAAFQTAARSPRRPVLVVGHGLVLATPSALDLLEPADHAAVQACAEGMRGGGEATHRLTLASGRTVRLRCAPVEGVEGALVDILPEQEGRRGTRGPGPTEGRPLLVVGEPGSGRTTEARRAVGPGAVVLDATDVVRQGERAWAASLVELLEAEGPAVVVENVQLLSERLTSLLARCLRGVRRETVLTVTPGDHLDGAHAPLVALCGARHDLVPLRRRRQDIPGLAQRMLAETSGTGPRRLTVDSSRVLAAQPWPGNLAELRRVVQAVARTRSAGDIIPSDLPASYREAPAPTSPFRQAEREIIVEAIKAAGGNKRQAARALGMSRSTLYNRMHALHIH